MLVYSPVLYKEVYEVVESSKTYQSTLLPKSGPFSTLKTFSRIKLTCVNFNCNC
jgi:hypothetical protein